MSVKPSYAVWNENQNKTEWPIGESGKTSVDPNSNEGENPVAKENTGTLIENDIASSSDNSTTGKTNIATESSSNYNDNAEEEIEVVRKIAWRMMFR